jgi:acyl-CoA thioesterase FadM
MFPSDAYARYDEVFERARIDFATRIGIDDWLTVNP